VAPRPEDYFFWEECTACAPRARILSKERYIRRPRAKVEMSRTERCVAPVPTQVCSRDKRGFALPNAWAKRVAFGAPIQISSVLRSARAVLVTETWRDCLFRRANPLCYIGYSPVPGLAVRPDWSRCPSPVREPTAATAWQPVPIVHA
jgi:hypothetical protein